MPIYTLGHSTRTTEEVISLLRENGIELLVDVRRFPGSRRHPHFHKDALAASLADAGMEYRHAEALGGRRGGGAESPNTAWRNASFRAYADHALTEPFREALAELIATGREHPVAILCSEAVPWRCHRRIISDHLVAQGIPVRHIMAPGRVDEHTLSAHAEARDDTVIYPGEQGELL